MSLRLPLVFLSLLRVGLADNATAFTSEQTTTTYNPTVTTPSSPAAATTATVDPKLYWVILHAENPSGLAGGQPCSIFDFAGVQCSLSFDYTFTSGSGSPVSKTTTFALGNSADSTDMSSQETPLSGSFQGFTISGTLKTGDQTVAVFAPYNVSTLTKGVATLFDPASGASVRFAWKSDLSPATTVTTAQSTTPAGSSTPGTQYTRTVTPMTPATYPRDCDEVIVRTDGVKTIYINNNSTQKVDVYCQFGSSGALTTIQSRGEGDDTTFGDNFDDYKKQFGTAGNKSNYWFGLDNMNLLTTGNVSYNLLVEVCCSGASTKQIYENFTIGDAASIYVLTAVADSTGIGLDLVAIGATNTNDIGQKFSTKNTINSTGINLSDCEILYRYDGTGGGHGGWWFGSCANNLNGNYFAANNGTLHETCSLDLSSTKDTGIELRTTTGIIDEEDGFYTDLVSYTRVRMAVYRSASQLQGISGFCNT